MLALRKTPQSWPGHFCRRPIELNIELLVLLSESAIAHCRQKGLEGAIAGHILGTAQLMGTSSRN